VTGAPIAQLVALVVDGRPISANPVNALLQRAGFRTIEAATGVAALDVLAGETVDLAVVAVTLPDMSGFELCEAIRGRSEMEWLPVVHVSATAVDVPKG
jgi:CheY-like chemotaxis protein